MEKEKVLYVLKYDYLDNGHLIKAGTKFSIVCVWHNCIQTTFGLISFNAWDFTVSNLNQEKTT